MATFNTPYLASSLPIFDPHHAARAPSTSANNDTTQTELYLSSSATVPSPRQTNSHRVSKAMKGKRVHACQRPGCTKVRNPRKVKDKIMSLITIAQVFTRAEHRRRHELSHEPKKKYHCTHEGCEKAFHRPDYLTQHLNRHTSAPTENKSYPQSDTSSRRTSLQPPTLPQIQPQIINQTPIPFQTQNTTDYPEIWGSMDSSMSYSYSQCSRGQSLSSGSVDDHPSPYSYTNETCSSPIATESFTNPQYPTSGMPVEMVTAVDQYLRSILKPEAFSSTQPQMSPAVWNSHLDIDPMLTKIGGPDQLPLYPWPSAHDVQYEDHPVQMNLPSGNC
ncbi:hypothetical protein N7475_006617 [Penicillium sp. IBT 31633x]|nr:hypothetical protein N7475_006617 [Penicillium sp. IBT 31633x]